MTHNNIHRRQHHLHPSSGCIVPIVLLLLFVPRVSSFNVILVPIFVIIIVASIFFRGKNSNSSRRRSEEKHADGTFSTPSEASSSKNQTSYESPNFHSDYDSNNSARAIISCPSCQIELEATSLAALTENGFVFCNFCGNKITK